MDPTFRQAFNAAYTDEFYKSFMEDLERRLDTKIPFRVAETPFFIPPDLRDRLARHAREIVAQISRPDVIDRMRPAIPARLDVPGMDPLPNCVQVDFAIVRNERGELDGRVVELQAFPSLYALMVIQSEVMAEHLRRIPGLDQRWSIYFDQRKSDAFVDKLRRAILGGEDPRHVVLLDIDPPNQKTYPDFRATKLLLDVDSVCPTELEKEGRKLYRRVGDTRLQVHRIYNRIVFDELENRKLSLPFDYRDDLDVTWFSHPNWYWVWSKYTLPFVDHPAVPRARTLAQMMEQPLPQDLSAYVMKPLFSFAGAGVKLDPTRADVDAVPVEDRDKWLLQEKIVYDPGITMPTGEGVKAEVRMMFLRAPDEEKPELVLNLVRLSRGKMLGVDHNKDLTWVGGSVGIWAE